MFQKFLSGAEIEDALITLYNEKEILLIGSVRDVLVCSRLAIGPLLRRGGKRNFYCNPLDEHFSQADLAALANPVNDVLKTELDNATRLISFLKKKYKIEDE